MTTGIWIPCVICAATLSMVVILGAEIVFASLVASAAAILALKIQHYQCCQGEDLPRLWHLVKED